MSKELQCPYCEEMNEASSDSNEPNVTHQQECSNCNKTFGFQIEYCPSYTEFTLPCANGESHDWQPLRIYPMNEHFAKFRRCTYCDEQTTIDKIKETVDERNK